MTSTTNTTTTNHTPAVVPSFDDLPVDFDCRLQPPDHFGISHLFTFPRMKVTEFYATDLGKFDAVYCPHLMTLGICSDRDCVHQHRPMVLCQPAKSGLSLADAFDVEKNAVWKKNIDYQVWLISFFYSEFFSAEMKAASRAAYLHTLKYVHSNFYDSFGFELLEADEPNEALLEKNPAAKEHFCIYERNHYCGHPYQDCIGSHVPLQLFIDVCHWIPDNKEGRTKKQARDLRNEEIVKMYKDADKDKFKGSQSSVIWSRFQYKLWLLKFYPFYQHCDPVPFFLTPMSYCHRKFTQDHDDSNQDIRELERLQDRIRKYIDLLQKKLVEFHAARDKEEERKVQEQLRQQAECKKQEKLIADNELYMESLQNKLQNVELTDFLVTCLENMDAIELNLNRNQTNLDSVSTSDLKSMVLLVNMVRTSDFVAVVQKGLASLLTVEPSSQRQKSTQDFRTQVDVILDEMKKYLEFLKRFKLIREKDKSKIPNRIKETVNQYYDILQAIAPPEVGNVGLLDVMLWLSSQLSGIAAKQNQKNDEVEANDLLGDCFSGEMALGILGSQRASSTLPLTSNVLTGGISLSPTSSMIGNNNSFLSHDNSFSAFSMPFPSLGGNGSVTSQLPPPGLLGPVNTLSSPAAREPVLGNMRNVSINATADITSLEYSMLSTPLSSATKVSASLATAGSSSTTNSNHAATSARVGSPMNVSITSNATTTTSSSSTMHHPQTSMFSMDQYVQRLNDLHDELRQVEGLPAEVYDELYFYCNTCTKYLDLKSYKAHQLNRRLKSHAVAIFCSECTEYRNELLFCPVCVNVEDRIPVACVECMPTLHDEGIDDLYSGHGYDFDHPICYPSSGSKSVLF